MKILVLNAGSSSQKCTLYESAHFLESSREIAPVWQASVEKESASQRLVFQIQTQTQLLEFDGTFDSWSESLSTVMNTLVSGKTRLMDRFDGLDVIGHRVVHGGAYYNKPARVNPFVKAHIKSLSVLAPQHNPVQLEGIELMERLAPEVPQIAVFDTAFHHTLPEYARAYPIPYEWYQKGICRFGFHGISHENCMERTAQILETSTDKLNIISCHLGNGVSLSAIRAGVCIDTTMGFSPLEGVMMGSRSGSVDPAILFHLMEHFEMDAEGVFEMLQVKSGLYGVSGISSDMRKIHSAIEMGNKRAQLALDMYVYRLRLAMGAMLAALGRVDAIVFTAGIGQNDPVVRERICEGFNYIGLHLDRKKNHASLKEQDISASHSSIRVLVLDAQENWAIAQKCWKTIDTSEIHS